MEDEAFGTGVTLARLLLVGTRKNGRARRQGDTRGLPNILQITKAALNHVDNIESIASYVRFDL